jgi:glucosamine--fructose-6-phosphate aminotransferase (isomerizing)
MARAARHVIELGTGEERSVAATKTYTASLGAVAALAAGLAGARHLRAELRAAPEAVAAQLEEPVGPAAELAAGWGRCAVVGRGANYGTAFEAALKIKELTGIAAEPFSPPDLMHGPIAILGPDHPLLAFAPAGPAAAGVAALLDEARRRRAPAVAATTDPAPAATVRLRLIPMPEWLSPLGAAIPAQLLAAALAERRGVEVDRPFGLSKVTRTT